MTLIPKKCLTMIAEQALESQLIAVIKRSGSTSFTIVDCEAGSASGLRAGDWDQNRNIIFRVVCDDVVANGIMTEVQERYCDNYFLVMYVSEILVHPASNL